MSSLGELKKLHDKGLSLIYLHPKEKRPIGNDWQKLPKKTWEELEQSHEPGYNVGVRLGAVLPTGKYLGAIDCDVKSKSRKAITEMNDKLRELGIDLDSAPIVMSGRGGGSKHVYVQTEKPMRPQKYASSLKKVKVLMPGENKAGKPHSKRELETLTPAERKEGWRIRAAWEISFMGTGQQTVLPPSVHPDTGFKYAWACPFMIKRLPTFKPAAFKREAPTLNIGDSSNTPRFKAEDVNLYETKLSVKFIKMIVDGEGCEDRSASLYSVTLAMCRIGFTDNQILSVLSNEDHWIAEAAYEHTQSRDRNRAVQWLHKYTLLKARYETDVMRLFDNKPSFEKLSKKEVASQVAEVIGDVQEVLPDLDKQGKPQATLRNLVRVLEVFLGGGQVGLNLFNGRPYFLTDTIYGGVKGKELADYDDLNLKHYIANHYRFEPSKELCFEAHTLLARKNAYHPVRDYLGSLVWDKVPRLDTWLERALNASGPTEYVNAVSRKMLVAAVTRVYEPGCKFDYVVILEGKQGKGKSTALGVLASAPWFTDGLGDIHSKDVVDQMTGKWVIEMGELASIRKAESENIKAFLSRQVDRVRMSYGKRSEDYPRQSIFVGSTNSSQYFSDETGNRRFWPVKVGKLDRKWINQNRDQLWAEAVMRYEIGENIYLSPELERLAQREQEERFDVDEWEEEVKAIVKKNPDGPFVLTELWRAINLTSANGHPPMAESKRIGKILHRLGYRSKTGRYGGLLRKAWVKQ